MGFDKKEHLHRKEYSVEKITIDRSIPFDPVTFLGKGWEIDEQDERALSLTKVDINNVIFDEMINLVGVISKGEWQKILEENGHIRLDAKVFQTLWENQRLIPKKWKENMKDRTTFIFFEGTTLLNEIGSLCFLCLYLCDGNWCWGCRWLGKARSDDFLSAVLMI